MYERRESRICGHSWKLKINMNHKDVSKYLFSLKLIGKWWRQTPHTVQRAGLIGPTKLQGVNLSSGKLRGPESEN